jgi:type IV pilus assembly protein PilE
MKRIKSNVYGLTLVEVLVAMAIIGILSSLAIPAYDRYTRNTARSTAKTAVERVRGLLESYYLNNKSYTEDLTALGFNASPLTVEKAGEEIAAASSNVVYEVAIHIRGGSGLTYCADCDYEVVATPKNAQIKDTDCDIFWFGSLGNKGATGPKGTACW